MAAIVSSSKSVFGFSSVEHFFASALGDLQKAFAYAEKVGTALEASASTVEEITGLVPGFGSQAVVLERAAFSALGLVIAAVHAASSAASANGLNVSLDQATVEAFEALIAGFKTDLAKMGFKL